MNWWQRLLSWFRRSTQRYPSQVGPIEPFSEADLVRLHNAERARAGLKPLTSDPRLTVRAQVRASNAAELELTAAHLHDGFIMTPGDSRDAENAAIGQADTAAVMALWMDSEGHRANILGPFTDIGCSRAISRNSKTYWYCCFAGR